MMDDLKILELPSLRRPTLIASFAGWPDAAEVASGSVKYLTRKLRPRRFAELDPERFYVFTDTRPSTTLPAPGQRALEWPSNEFFGWRDPSGTCDLVLLDGREPNVNWRGYIDALMTLIIRCDVQRVVTLGGTYDAVSHRGPVHLSGHGTTAEIRSELERLGIQGSSYQGPSSLQSAVLDACHRGDIAAASLWGHAPHYVRASPNPKVSHGMLQALRIWLEVDLDLVELRISAGQLETKVNQAIEGNAELREYVDRLGVADESPSTAGRPPDNGSASPPSTADVFRELEELLRQRQQDDEPA